MIWGKIYLYQDRAFGVYHLTGRVQASRRNSTSSEVEAWEGTSEKFAQHEKRSILLVIFVHLRCLWISPGGSAGVEPLHDQRPALFDAVLQPRHKIRSSMVGTPLLLASVVECHRQSWILPLITSTFHSMCRWSNGQETHTEVLWWRSRGPSLHKPGSSNSIISFPSPPQNDVV